MTDPKLKEDELAAKTPYDLWPDEVETVSSGEPVHAFPDHTMTNEPAPQTAFQPWDAPPDQAGEGFDAPFEAPFIPVAYTPETTDQTVRNSGLAWSAGVVFFGAVAFMLVLGWLADWMLGSSPFGVVIGIILGSIIGFLQFFRISSQIFSAKKPDPDHRPLLTRDDDLS